MLTKPQFTSRVWVVQDCSTIADTTNAFVEELNREGYKVISQSVFIHPNYPTSSARVSVLGQLRKVKP